MYISKKQKNFEDILEKITNKENITLNRAEGYAAVLEDLLKNGPDLALGKITKNYFGDTTALAEGARTVMNYIALQAEENELKYDYRRQYDIVFNTNFDKWLDKQKVQTCKEFVDVKNAGNFL